MSRPSHHDACQAFRWEESARAMGFPPGAPVNLGRAIVDRHAASDRAALRFGKGGEARTYTFDELARLTARFANALRELGVGPGDRVAGFLPRIPEMLIAMIGAWKAGAVYVPIFTGFGPDATEFRARHSGARVLVTQWEQRGRLPAPLPDGVTVVTVTGPAAGPPGDVDFWRVMEGQPDTARLTDVRRQDPAVLLYTSGSTGPPKGVKIAANFLVAIHPHLVHGADLLPDDVFWPTGDPGWGYGLVCYMGALALGVPVLSHEAAPAPEFCVARLRELGVTNLATTPTLLRGVMALGAAAAGRGALRVRSASSCGEPLNAEVVRFFREHWSVTVRDQYGSSEFGLPIGNFATVEMAVKPGSMGLPLPGCEIAVVDDGGREVGPDVVGHVGMKPHPAGYYSLGYWNDEDRDREMYRGEWMTCGDLARRDAEGYFWFEGRADDVIKSAGYRIGPFEVESAILKHPAVAEAAVVGK
ncbi:MAG TPA: AMP-binding protein, partial [Methylomirabilota bacterium]